MSECVSEYVCECVRLCVYARALIFFFTIKIVAIFYTFIRPLKFTHREKFLVGLIYKKYIVYL